MKTLGIASVLLLLSACGQPEPIAITPPAEWTAPVEEPAVPDEATDESVAGYIVDLIDALREANNRLKRLDDWRAELSESPTQ